MEAAIKYKGNTYDILRFNCNDFADEMAIRLCGSHIPKFVNRLAKVGKVFKKKISVNDGLIKNVAY